ncbi:TPA: Ig-like domain-containing protein, partial [Morganella morganii]|nr:Ig-like domain-containing protein [Morganella morganii]
PDYSINVGSAAEIKLSVVTNNVLADGVKKNAVKATVYDSQKNSVKGALVEFDPITNATITPNSTTTDDNGEVTADIQSAVSGSYTISAGISGTEVKSSADIYFTLNPESTKTDVTAFNSSAVIASADVCKAGVQISGVPESAQTGINYRIALKATGPDGKPVYASGSAADKIKYTLLVTVVSGNQKDIFVTQDKNYVKSMTGLPGLSYNAVVVSTDRLWQPRLCATSPVTVIVKPYITIGGEEVKQVSPSEGVTLKIK